jgi:hypothetical protein
MKDQHVVKVRRARQAHATVCGNDLHEICEDLRRKEESLAPNRLVTLQPVAVRRSERPMIVAESKARYAAKPNRG